MSSLRKELNKIAQTNETLEEPKLRIVEDKIEKLAKLEDEFVRIHEEKYSVVSLRKMLECIVLDVCNDMSLPMYGNEFAPKISEIRKYFNSDEFLVEPIETLKAIETMRRFHKVFSQQIHDFSSEYKEMNVKSSYQSVLDSVGTLFQSVYFGKFNKLILPAEPLKREVDGNVSFSDIKKELADNKQINEMFEEKLEVERKFEEYKIKVQEDRRLLEIKVSDAEKELEQKNQYLENIKEQLRKTRDQKEIFEFDLTKEIAKNKRAEEIELRLKKEIKNFEQETAILQTKIIGSVNPEEKADLENKLSNMQQQHSNALDEIQQHKEELLKRDDELRSAYEKINDLKLKIEQIDKESISFTLKSELLQKEKFEKELETKKLEEEYRSAIRNIENEKALLADENMRLKLLFDEIQIAKNEVEEDWKRKVKRSIGKQLFNYIQFGDDRYYSIKQIDEHITGGKDMFADFAGNDDLKKRREIMKVAFDSINKNENNDEELFFPSSNIGPFLGNDSSLMFDEKSNNHYVMLGIKPEKWEIWKNNAFPKNRGFDQMVQWHIFNAWAKGIKKIKVVIFSLDNINEMKIFDIDTTESEPAYVRIEKELIEHIKRIKND